MRGPVKAAVWTAVFLACAGAGAYIAAHTDPFPPGVEDPGSRLTESPSSATPKPAGPQRWIADLRSRTYHQLYVGGRCRTSWKGSVAFTITKEGLVDGTGDVRLEGDPVCDFPVAQVQTLRIHVRLSGSFHGRDLRFGFTEGGRVPVGSGDLGGLTNTLRQWRPTLHVADHRASGTTTVTKPDGDRGTYGAVTTFRIRCVDRCG